MDVRMKQINIILMILFGLSAVCSQNVVEKIIHRVARQGGPPPPGGTGGGTGGGMTSPYTLTTNYNYADSTKTAESDPVITSWIKATGRSTTYNCVNNVNKIQYSAKYVYVSAAGIPSYTIGPYGMNPNTASNQDWTFQLPRVPVQNTGNKTAVSLNSIGVWLNGVTVFNADDGQSILGWKRNAYYFEGDSFDACGGHPQQSGVYHNHVMPYCIFNSTDSTKHSPIIGYAFDGFPIYGPFGYSNPSSASSSIKRILSSYRKRSIGTRTTLANGTTQAGPSINSTYPLGAFMDDFEYAVGVGDLDEYNGRFGVTPEYPSGTYAYFTTTDATGNAAYPYTLGYYFYGHVVSANLVTGKVTATETVTTYYAYSNSIMIKSNWFCYLLIISLSFFVSKF